MYTERTIYHKRCHFNQTVPLQPNGATSSCLAASSVHFTTSDLDFKWMSHE